MDFQAKQTHRRMMKVPLLKRPRAIHEERSDAAATAAVLQLRQYTSSGSAATVTQTVAAETLAASSTSVPAVSPLPTSTAALAGVGAFFGLAIIMVGICCFLRRRKLRSRLNKKNKAPSASFNQTAMFVEKKDPFAAVTFDQHLEVNLSPSIKIHPPTTPSTASSSEDSGWRAPTFALRVKNHTESYTGMPSLPKAVAEKNRASQGATGKPSKISIHAEEFVGSPPPSYDMANGSPGFVFPALPSQMPAEKSRAVPTPPTPPARQKSFRTSKKEKVANLQALVVPTHAEPAPIVSPARSESFAPKELVIPPPPPALSAASSSSSGGSGGGSSQGFNHAEMRGPRLMTVIAQYTPTLADELHISVGDTVRLMQQYKDGWGFVQHVGKGDAPRGVVPLICLQERKQMVPTMSHKASNSSNGSINVGWR